MVPWCATRSTSPARRGRARGRCWCGPAPCAPDANPPVDAAPTEDRPWLAGMERLDDPRLARRFVTSRLLYRRLRRYLWAPPCCWPRSRSCCASTSWSTALGRIFRSPRQQDRAAARLRRHVVLPSPRDTGHRDRPARGAGPRGGRHLARHLAGARRRRAARPLGRRPVGYPPHRPRPTRDRRGGRAGRHPGRGRARRRRASSSAGRSSPSSRISTPDSSPARAPPPRWCTSTGVGWGSRRRSCTTVRSRPSRLRRGRTCTSACSSPRLTCRWRPWASGSSPPTS